MTVRVGEAGTDIDSTFSVDGLGLTADYLRPDADDADGGWTNELGGTTLFSSIDESSLDDADYIKSAPGLGDDTCRVRLSNPSGVTYGPAKVRVRYRGVGDTADLTVKLKQDTTEIASWQYSDIAETFVTVTETLTDLQLAAITDFDDLYIEFVASFQWWLADSTIDLDFENGRYYDGAVGADVTDYLSCSRASISYAQTAAGTLTQFADNQLRITTLGLLIEDARTNNTAHSQDLSALTSSQVTVTENQTAAPDGTVTASKFVEDTNGGRHMNFASPFGSVADGVVYAYSCYFKQGTQRYAGLNLIGDGAVGIVSAVIDLQTGTVTQTDGTYFDSASVEALANGWYRLIVIMSGTGLTTGTPNTVIFTSDSATPTLVQGSASYTGDGSSFIYVWGKQFEIGAFASSYIPTTTAAATRAADVVTTTGALESLLGTLPQSAVVSAISDFAMSQYTRLIGDSTGAAQTILNVNADNVSVGIYDNSVLLSANLGGSVTLVGGFKAGSSQDISGRSVVGGGGTVSTDANKLAISNTRIGFGAGWYGYFRRITVWDTRLADATLQGFTNP